LSLSALVFDGAGYPRALHSFPTRRSSDLAASAIRCTMVAASATLFITTTWLRTPTVPSARRYPINSGSAIDRHPSLLGLEAPHIDRKSTRLNSSHVKISYAVFCLKKKNIQ